MFPFLVPWPSMEHKPQVVKAYEESEWRREDMSLLEFCRKTNQDGQIARWVRRKLAATDKEAMPEGEGRRQEQELLEAFANACPMRGEKLVACDMLSIYNDRWFGQWLVLRKPFRSMETLLVPEVVEKARI